MTMVRFYELALVALCAVVFCTVERAQAQSANEVVWVQIEAHPNLTTAQRRVQDYAGTLEDVNGFALGGGWYGVALGPYTRPDAALVLRTYRRDGLIPRDSYIALSNSYSSQFFPIGANVLNRGVIAPAPTEPVAQAETPLEDAPAAEVAEIYIPDETVAQARRSERRLSGVARRELQKALQWAGFYDAAIDGAFGPGTRRSMAAFQTANGFDITGVLTTGQRAELFRQYNAVIADLGLELVRDDTAGIEIQVPKAAVAFDKYEYPFAQYSAKDDASRQLLLISQEGDQTSLYGLYDIMQTLEIVPLDGERERRGNSFLLIGENDDIISHTEVGVEKGQIKGFTLVWPTGDEARRVRLIEAIRASFTRIDGVLDPSWTDADAQAVDLVSGLELRKPKLSRSGFFIDERGRAVTAYEAVQSCTRITLDDDTEMTLTASDADLGLAVLEPAQRIAPRAVAMFSGGQPRLQSDIAMAGYSYGGTLGAPTMTFGQLSDLRGLQGEETLARLNLEMLDGDAGGPVFDENGAVFAMVLPRPDGGKVLPSDVAFAANAQAIKDILNTAGISTLTMRVQAPMAAEDITAQARDITVLVNCWE